MDRDAKIRMYAKLTAKVVLIIAVVEGAFVALFLVIGYGTSGSMPSITSEPLILSLSLVMILMGIGFQAAVLYPSGGLPALSLYFDGWAGGVLSVAIGSSLAHSILQGPNLRTLVSIIITWALFVGTIVLNFVVMRKLTRPV